MVTTVSDLTYSALASRLKKAIDSSATTNDQVLSLLVESRQRALSLHAASALKLHNRLVREILAHSNGFCLIEYRVALQFVPHGALKRIEDEYRVDPSSPGVALMLAIGYLSEGIKPRAAALLDRISRSGNSEEAAIARNVLRILGP